LHHPVPEPLILPGLIPASLFPGKQSLLDFFELLDSGKEAKVEPVDLNVIELVDLLRKYVPLSGVV
jgi:hypothetical protein